MTKDAANTITKTVYNDLDRPVDILQAVSTGDLREITHSDYDSRGNLWKVTQYAGNDSSLTTVMDYDGRNRLSSTTGPDGVRTQYTWDNLGRQTRVETYDALGNLIATTDAHYDERGQVYQTEEYGVSLGQARVTKYWHDADGRVWKTQSPEGLITETEYDGLGRVKETRLRGADDSHCLLQNTTTDYDAHGNVILTSSWQYGEGEAVRKSYVAYWYDRYDRLQYVADYGDNDGQTFSRPNTPPEPNTTDNAIVTKYLYDSLGRQDRTIDNKGRVTQTVFDALGRQVRVVENCTHTREEIVNAPDGFRPQETESDANRTTAYLYDSAGRLHQLIAYNPKGSGLGVQAQVTSYSYDDPINGDLTTDVLYPADTAPVHFAYDQLGRKTGMTDQRGTHHRYEYDSAGRLDADRVLSFAGADDAVTAITCEYDAASRLKSVSSLDANANVMNQILYTYDDWGNVQYEYQSHQGPVDLESPPPATHYVYDSLGLHLTETIYPGGLHVYYNHDVNSRVANVASSAQPGDAQKYVAYAYLGLGTVVKVTHPAVPGGLTLDYGQDGSAGLDRFGRVVYHAWTQRGTDGTANVIDGYAYGYDRASNRLYRRNLVNPAFSELYGAGGADSQRQYDGLDRLVGFQRGTLRADNRSVASADSTQSWQLDSLGNWSSTTTDGTTQDRTHDAANEITSIGGASTTVDYDAAGNMTRIPVPGAETTAYYLCTYDAWNRLAGVFHDDGNTAGQLDSADTLVAAYRYDGLNRRIAKIIPLYADSQNPTTPTGYDRTDYLFNLDWQVLEERFEGNVGTDLKDAPAEAIHVQYVWDIRYIDTPVLRIRDTAGPNGPDGALDPAVDEVVYYLTDANMNVTALVDATAGSPTAGEVVERYMYDAYGKATILNGPADADNHPNATPPATVPDWSADADQKSDLGNAIFFAGYPLDPETGMYLARNRYLQSTLGRWTSVDPAQYRDGVNLYQYGGGSPTNDADPFGLFHIEFPTTGPLAGYVLYRGDWWNYDDNVFILFGQWTDECGGGYRIWASRYVYPFDYVFSAADLKKAAMLGVPDFSDQEALTTWFMQHSHLLALGYIDPKTEKARDSRPESHENDADEHVKAIQDPQKFAAAIEPHLVDAVEVVGAWWQMGPSLLNIRAPISMARASSTPKMAGLTIKEVEAKAPVAAAEGTLPKGSFSIRDWTGYPEGLAKPKGPFRLLEGAEYDAARNAANAANRAMHQADPTLRDLLIHEIHPVKFGGSPINRANKVPLTPQVHRQYTNWWRDLMRSINGG